MTIMDFPNAPTVGQTWPSPPVAGQPVYTWDGVKWTVPIGGVPVVGTPILSDGSVSMAADLKLFGDPTTPLAAADKHYVDNAVQSSAAGGVRYDQAQTLTAAQMAQARANIGALKKNYLVNGAMQIAQEWGTASVTGSVYPVDQFGLSMAGAGAIAGNQAVGNVSPAGSQTRLHITVQTVAGAPAASDVCQVFQVIEGLRCLDLNFGLSSAKTVTLQFGVKAPAGTYGVSLRNYAGARSYVAEYIVTPAQANIDTMFAVTFLGDAAGTWAKDNTGSMIATWNLRAGSTSQTTPGAWQSGNFTTTANQFNFTATAGNVFELFDVGLYEGSVAPPFQVPDYATEVALCMRYFEMGEEPTVYMSGLASTANAYGSLPFKVVKRAPPTMSVGTAWTYFSGGSGVTFTPNFNSTINSFYWQNTGFTNWNGWTGVGTWKASARL